MRTVLSNETNDVTLPVPCSPVQRALSDGYKPFHPTGRIGEEVHYTNYRFARREQKNIDYRQPGSILYRRTGEGMKAVGVMYTAPRDSTPEQLNGIAPLSVATWHRHVDFCAGPRTLPLSEQFSCRNPFSFRRTVFQHASRNQS